MLVPTIVSSVDLENVGMGKNKMQIIIIIKGGLVGHIHN
jgi:hypothetical protein